jgi:hypothetical protein
MSQYADSPYAIIPGNLYDMYTMNGKIPVTSAWYDDSNPSGKFPKWDQEYVNAFRSRFNVKNILSNKHGEESYEGASVMILTALLSYDIRNKNVAVVGSLSPWIEAMLLNMGNKVTTIEYNVPDNDCEITCMHYTDFEKTENMYDCIVTYSSIEHSGLGRYGDPLDPDGDIRVMDVIRKNLVEDGILVLGVPVGMDALAWNAHRVYGNIRLSKLTEGFVELQRIGTSNIVYPLGWGEQPVIVLKK